METSRCCPPVFQSRLKKDDADALASAFKALSDPARLRLLSFIADQPNGEACVCFLTAPVGLSQPTVTHHLQLLNKAGLVEREKRGPWVYYRIAPARLEQLRAALAPPAAPRALRSRTSRPPRARSSQALTGTRKAAT